MRRSRIFTNVVLSSFAIRRLGNNGYFEAAAVPDLFEHDRKAPGLSKDRNNVRIVQINPPRFRL